MEAAADMVETITARVSSISWLLTVINLPAIVLAYSTHGGPTHSYTIPEQTYGGYEHKPAVHSSYGPPKVIESYVKSTPSYIHEPHSSYGAPQFTGKGKLKGTEFKWDSVILELKFIEKA